MILEADEVVGVGHQILLPELHARVRLPSVARVSQAHRLHRPVAQRIDPAPRQLFYRQTRLEPARLLEALERDALRADERLVEARVLLLVHRAVEVVVPALPVTRRAEGDAGVHGIGRDDGRDGVVKVEPRPRGQPRDLLGQSVRAERPGRDDTHGILVDTGRLFPHYFDVGVRLDAPGYLFGELLPVDGERRARRNLRPHRHVQDDGAGAAQLLLQKVRRRPRLVGLQRVRTDDL